MKTQFQIKKKYSKPLIEVIQLDHEISLVMMTGPPLDEDGNPLPPKPSPNAFSSQGPTQISSTSADNDPFGGSGPQY